MKDEIAVSRTGTAKDRAELFDYILAATLRREAGAPHKRSLFNLDHERDMSRWRDEMIAADSDEDLFYALHKISNARHDRHLSVEPVEGGIAFPATFHDSIIGVYSDPRGQNAPQAPLRLSTDFSDRKNPRLFLADVPTNFATLAPGQRIPERGAWLTSINGLPLATYLEKIDPYFCYSTPAFFWYHLGTEVVRKTALLPASFYGKTLDLGFEGRDGKALSLCLPYVDRGGLDWTLDAVQRYDGFEKRYGVQSYDLYVDRTRKVVALNWHGFGKELIADMDRLMATAAKEKLLDYDLIFDGTRSRGGDFGGYALTRLSPKPYKGTFGNLRISDVTERLAYGLLAEDAARIAGGNVHPDVANEVAWRREWIATDLTQAIRTGKRYSNNVPFKSVHKPKWSDGVIEPAPVHFRGRMVCLFGPFGGSHIDQFAANVVDNNLCTAIGMPQGGFSKTWVWEEALKFPRTGQPVATFMWNCGNTLRPNGEVLESNPAEVHEFIPPTRDNYGRYHAMLVERALTLLA